MEWHLKSHSMVAFLDSAHLQEKLWKDSCPLIDYINTKWSQEFFLNTRSVTLQTMEWHGNNIVFRPCYVAESHAKCLERKLKPLNLLLSPQFRSFFFGVFPSLWVSCWLLLARTRQCFDTKVRKVLANYCLFFFFYYYYSFNSDLQTDGKDSKDNNLSQINQTHNRTLMSE